MGNKVTVAERRLQAFNRARDTIRAGDIVKELERHILGDNGVKYEMSATQVTAALGLLRKVMPDLVPGHGGAGGEIVIKILTGVEADPLARTVGWGSGSIDAVPAAVRVASNA